MTELVVVMLVAVAGCVVLVGGAVWVAGRAVRRLHRVGRRAVDRSILSVKARALPPGRGRQVAGLRLDLRAGVVQTRRVLDDAVRHDCSLGELPRLFRRVERLAASVDAELRLLEGRADVAEWQLRAAEQRAGELVAMAAKIRQGASAVRADLTSDLFGSLHREVELEVSAVRAGAAVVRQPGG
jgi:hypothetical protein